MGYRLYLSTREAEHEWCGGKYYGYEDVSNKPSYKYLKLLFGKNTPLFFQYCYAELALTPAEAENFIRLYIEELLEDCDSFQEVDNVCKMKSDAIKILRNTHNPVLLEWS